MPPSPKEHHSPGGLALFLLLLSALGVGGGVLGGTLAGPEGAIVGVLIGINLYGNFLKPAKKGEERQVFEAICGAITSLFLWLAATALLAADHQSMRQALYIGADRRPITF